MSHKWKIPGIERIEAVEMYLRGEGSRSHIAELFGVSEISIIQWEQTYHSLGPLGLMNSSKNSSYPAELKVAAVKDYLAGRGSYMELCRKYGIKSTRQLRDWVLKYNGHEELKSSGSGGTIMTKGRKTTFKERVEIVKHCIEHDRNYIETSVKYSVSYQEIYSWVKKYDQHGIDGLIDRRGKSKAKEPLTDIERLQYQNKLLEAKNKRLEMENELLKKIQEIERRRY